MQPRGQSATSDDKTWVPWDIAVWGLIVAYIAFFSLLTVQKHNAFQTTAFDLGNVDQAVWNTRHGRPLAMTNIEGLTNRLGTHVEPILLPISLLYFLWSDPRALLLLQTIVIALGAWPVYLIAKRTMRDSRFGTRDSEFTNHASRFTPHVSRLTSHALPLIFSLSYLLFPALQSANVFDFHAVALAPAFFLFAFYFLETERWSWYALFALLTMACKEDMALLVGMLGLYALVVRRRWRVGLATILIAGVWFVLAVGAIMPYFDPEGVAPLANRYAYLGDTPLEITITMITQPGMVLGRLLTAETLAYLLNLLAPVAFLPVLAPQVLMLAAPTLLINLLSTDGFMQQLEGFHYGAPLAPIVVVSAAYGAAWLLRRFPRTRYLPLVLAGAVLAATLVYHSGHGYTPLAAGFRGSWPAVTDHHRLGGEMARGIPTDASLAALPHPNPHASQRQQMTMIDRVEEGLPAPLHDANGVLADYVWLDVTHGWPLHPNDLEAAVDGLLAGDYGIEEAADGWLLLRRGSPSKELPAAFYDFARTAEPQPQYPMQLQFLLDGQPALECLGFDLILQPPTSNLQSPTPNLRLYCRALQPLPPDIHLYPFFFDDASGEILEETSLRPMIASVWYPPARWRPGETVVTSTLPWDVGSEYSIGLGVVRQSSPQALQRDDWDAVDQRLPIHVESSELVVRLFDGDTWARLLHVEDGEPLEERRILEPPEPEHSLNVDFNSQIRLLGYDLDTDPESRISNLRLYWQAVERPAANYTVFAQLLGPAGNVRAQVDSSPQGGGYPTTWWLPGEVIADPLTLELSPDAPRDVVYRLIVGLYDPATGERLIVSGAGADFVELIAVEP
jgi:uncharacterized membrane protein